jgi:hypothetical protein
VLDFRSEDSARRELAYALAGDPGRDRVIRLVPAVVARIAFTGRETGKPWSTPPDAYPQQPPGLRGHPGIAVAGEPAHESTLRGGWHLREQTAAAGIPGPG